MGRGDAMKRKLGFGSLGNGVTVWDSLHEKDGDYVQVAHISYDREITFYLKRLELEYRKQIEDYARHANPMRSTCQQDPVFYGKPPEPRESVEVAKVAEKPSATPYLDMLTDFKDYSENGYWQQACGK